MRPSSPAAGGAGAPVAANEQGVRATGGQCRHRRRVWREAAAGRLRRPMPHPPRSSRPAAPPVVAGDGAPAVEHGAGPQDCFRSRRGGALRRVGEISRLACLRPSPRAAAASRRRRCPGHRFSTEPRRQRGTIAPVTKRGELDPRLVSAHQSGIEGPCARARARARALGVGRARARAHVRVACRAGGGCWRRARGCASMRGRYPCSVRCALGVLAACLERSGMEDIFEFPER